MTLKMVNDGKDLVVGRPYVIGTSHHVYQHGQVSRLPCQTAFRECFSSDDRVVKLAAYAGLLCCALGLHAVCRQKYDARFCSRHAVLCWHCRL